MENFRYFSTGHQPVNISDLWPPLGLATTMNPLQLRQRSTEKPKKNPEMFDSLRLGLTFENWSKTNEIEGEKMMRGGITKIQSKSCNKKQQQNPGKNQGKNKGSGYLLHPLILGTNVWAQTLAELYLAPSNPLTPLQKKMREYTHFVCLKAHLLRSDLTLPQLILLLVAGQGSKNMPVEH